MNIIAGLLASDELIDPAASHHSIFPARAELIWGTIASIIIFGALIKFAGPMIKKAFRDRTAKVQGELDSSADDLAAAQTEAADIRRAAGDIESERQRLLADADVQAELVLTDGRARLEQEVIELEARADADIAAAGTRVNDEVRAEISRLANEATERVLAGGAIDDATQQQLIESYIQKVGASQ